MHTSPSWRFKFKRSDGVSAKKFVTLKSQMEASANMFQFYKTASVAVAESTFTKPSSINGQKIILPPLLAHHFGNFMVSKLVTCLFFDIIHDGFGVSDSENPKKRVLSCKRKF